MEKNIALKFIIHFVGDLHQPMHISHAEDKGGNSIQLRYNNQGTNLHALWDSKMIEYQGLNYVELANNCDVATQKNIDEWQSDDLIKWIFESYKISSKLYDEVEYNKNINEEYYNTNIKIIQNRLERGGIRLAGVLNSCLASFNDEPILNNPTIPFVINKTISINDVNKYIDQEITVKTKMYGYKTFENMTLVNMGAEYPNQLLTVVLKGKLIELYKKFASNDIFISGKVINYKGKPEIIVTENSQIKISKN